MPALGLAGFIDPLNLFLLDHSTTLRTYYRWHAVIYDATRWSFLFGRNEILRRLEPLLEKTPALLEVGCGTGRNLAILAKKHPGLALMGVDLSSDMLQKASLNTQAAGKQVRLIEQAYGTIPVSLPRAPHAVLFSYALTMFNPGWEAAIERAYADLPIGGCIAIVDFHRTRFGWFSSWMQANHVRMDAHLLPFLKQHFEPYHQEVKPAYGGVWEYFLFIGVKKSDKPLNNSFMDS
jgi:S-adenosylmethionine-diacylgycerolhomoserine-N-methlytransferase